MMRVLQAFIVSALIALSSTALAGDGGALTPAQTKAISETAVQGTAKIDPPRELYHWLSAESLAKQAKEYRELGFFPLKALNMSRFGTHFREFASVPGLFAWSHPVLGMAFEGFEVYGNAERVLRFEIRPDAKTLLMVSDHGVIPPRAPVNPKDYDLVLHVSKYPLADGTYRVAFQEWVILNPDAIRAVTADPDVLRPFVSSWIAKAKTKGVPFPEEDMHVNSFFYMEGVREKRMVKSLEKWDALPETEIPEEFRGTVVLKPNPEGVEKYRCRVLLLPPDPA